MAETAARSLRRATAALDAVGSALVAMRPDALERCPARLEDAAAALNAVLRIGVSASDKAAVLALKARLDQVGRLAAAGQKFCGVPEEEFRGYTVEGENEIFDKGGTLVTAG